MALNTSIKHVQIDKAKSTIFLIIIGATVVTVFSLFAVRALIDQGSYQRKVLAEKQKAINQLQDNAEQVDNLVSQYRIFAEQDTNVLGGSRIGNTPLDGENTRIALDALPSKYDFPALTSSIEKILNGRSIATRAISGSDDSISNADKPQSQPTVVEIEVGFEGLSTYQTISELIKDFERSIRPFDILRLEMSGSDNNLRISVEAKTYYQPSKSLNLEDSKEVK